jgi:serine/threonine protein kinase
VAAACGDDAELRVQVEALLAAHDQAGEFLASPTGAGADAAAKAVAEQASDHPPEGPGTQIGPYKLLELIGEGGFGTVYMADQVGPIRRRVALKIIKPGMDTKEVIARFESERQALAMMDHPNIARVLDAGAAESGRPYFVMELVKGVPITEYCDANRLSTRERLDLFVDVCKAVHHAHEKGVIHRDIKPSNVMVTLHDGTPVPKVIDFGIAKATNHPLTEKTLFTAYGQFLGTPIYMSPEQAALGGLEIDRRCDVYALGVLLYELLTGTTPFEPAALRSRAFMQLMRIIREEDPPTPSARLNTLGERLTEIAASRHVEPSALAKLVRGDLDWIVMRAIEKDRRRRYDSAVDLAADLSRYFRHEPVIARKPSAAYRLSKFAKRRRGLILATGGIAGAVLLGVALAQSVRKSNAEPAPPTNHLFIDWLRDSGMTPPTRDGRHRLRYSLARHGYEVVNIATGKVQPFHDSSPDPLSEATPA